MYFSVETVVLLVTVILQYCYLTKVISMILKVFLVIINMTFHYYYYY